MDDINHPRLLLVRWRDEADSLDRHGEQAEDAAARVFAAVANMLRRCAEQLEDRLNLLEA